jgi:hypothetical protein
LPEKNFTTAGPNGRMLKTRNAAMVQRWAASGGKQNKSGRIKLRYAFMFQKYGRNLRYGETGPKNNPN